MPDRRGTSRASRPSRRELGRLGERLAEDFLRRQGFRILARNLHLRHAELDLLALEARTLCFVEVRLRRSLGLGSAAESVTPRKQRRIAAAAAHILATHSLPPHEALRFDVVVIDARSDPPRIELIRAAFTIC